MTNARRKHGAWHSQTHLFEIVFREAGFPELQHAIVRADEQRGVVDLLPRRIVERQALEPGAHVTDAHAGARPQPVVRRCVP